MGEQPGALVGQLRGDVDDPTLAAGHHVAENGLGHEERALDVHAEHAVVVGLGDVGEVLIDVMAGVVDQDADVAERAHGVGVEGPDGVH
nr:hypothetical protein [Pseudonocardia sp. MH-G8]